MLQHASKVPLLGAHTSNKCLCDHGRHSHAFIYVGNEEDGNVFIQDIAKTQINGAQLTAEWSLKSRPNMVPPAHRLQTGEDISYWHHMEGEITQTQLQGTVPQTQDGPPETQNQQAQHGDPQMNIHSTPDIVHTVDKPGAWGAGWSDPSTAAGA